MPRVEYDGIIFDSQLEVDYYKYLVDLKNKGEVIRFTYHPCKIVQLVGSRSYTPDFIVEYADRIEVVEDKGYCPYSVRIDDAIHQVMLGKTESWLAHYVLTNDYVVNNKQVLYKKYKYLKAYGFVEWDFKNPNTLANKRKVKINEQKDEIKELKEYRKRCDRYFEYVRQAVHGKKLNRTQRTWMEEFEKEKGIN